MSTFRLLVIDIDGTLIGADLTPSPRVRAALRLAETAGLRLALCTGRTHLACPDLIAELGLAGPHIFLDGAWIADHTGTRIVFSRPIARPDLTTLVAACRSAGVDLELYTATGYFVERRSDLVQIHEAVQGITARVADLDAVIAAGGVIKGECLAEGAAGQAAVQQIEADLLGRLHFGWAKVAGYPALDFVNVVAPDVSKGTALRALAAWHGLTPAATVAIGDGRNDIPMIQAAGFGVAMGNAAPEVVAIADWVTAPVDADGLALMIERLVENQLVRFPAAGSE